MRTDPQEETFLQETTAKNRETNQLMDVYEITDYLAWIILKLKCQRWWFLFQEISDQKMNDIHIWAKDIISYNIKGTFQIYLICVSNNATYYVEKINHAFSDYHEQFPLVSSKVSN